VLGVAIEEGILCYETKHNNENFDLNFTYLAHWPLITPFFTPEVI
jgi:hypothetical protein